MIPRISPHWTYPWSHWPELATWLPYWPRKLRQQISGFSGYGGNSCWTEVKPAAGPHPAAPSLQWTAAPLINRGSFPTLGGWAASVLLWPVGRGPGPPNTQDAVSSCSSHEALYCQEHLPGALRVSVESSCRGRGLGKAQWSHPADWLSRYVHSPSPQLRSQPCPNTTSTVSRHQWWWLHAQRFVVISCGYHCGRR